MRATTIAYLEQLPARKRVTMIMLFCVIFGGVIATGGALA